jgi:alpha-N-arabinofuranosidase
MAGIAREARVGASDFRLFDGTHTADVVVDGADSQTVKLAAELHTVSGNTIHDIHVQRLFSGAEMAGIKFYGPIDATISGNHIYRTCRGIWLDWMTQGTRVSGNLCHDNATHDLMVEANHGPFVVDNNIFLSPKAIEDSSQGGAYAHNLIAGGSKAN